METNSRNLWQRFVKGLWEKYQMKPEDLEHFILIGNDPGSYGDEYECVCYQKIKHRFFIADARKIPEGNFQILTIGCVCKNQFCGTECYGCLCRNCGTRIQKVNDFLCKDCRKIICYKCYEPFHIYITACSNKKHEPVPGKCAMCINLCPTDKDYCFKCAGYKYSCLDCGKYANWEFCDDCIVAMGFFNL